MVAQDTPARFRLRTKRQALAGGTRGTREAASYSTDRQATNVLLLALTCCAAVASIITAAVFVTRVAGSQVGAKPQNTSSHAEPVQLRVEKAQWALAQFHAEVEAGSMVAAPAAGPCSHKRCHSRRVRVQR